MPDEVFGQLVRVDFFELLDFVRILRNRAFAVLGGEPRACVVGEGGGLVFELRSTGYVEILVLVEEGGVLGEVGFEVV